MLRIGGAETISVPLIPPPPRPPPRPPPSELPDITDGLSTTANNRLDSVNNVTELFATKPGSFLQPTVGSSFASDQIPPPTPTYDYKLEPVQTYIVGPVIDMYFSTANASDAGFTVDLRFRHHSYAEASHHIIL